MSTDPIHILTTRNASISLIMRDWDNRAYPRTALEQLKLQNRVHSKMRAQWLAPSRLLPIAFLLLFIYIVHLLVLQTLVWVDKLANWYRIPGSSSIYALHDYTWETTIANKQYNSVTFSSWFSICFLPLYDFKNYIAGIKIHFF